LAILARRLDQMWIAVRPQARLARYAVLVEISSLKFSGDHRRPFALCWLADMAGSFPGAIRCTLITLGRDACLAYRRRVSMLVRIICRIALFGLSVCAAGASAQALTAKECSAKYKVAQQAGALGAMTWSDFRKAQCGGEATAQPVAAIAAGTSANPLKPTPPPSPAAMPAATAVFPRTVSPNYASEKPGAARLHTCRDQYQANKTSGGNAGLPWMKKGGGYYSECSKRLKGA